MFTINLFSEKLQKEVRMSLQKNPLLCNLSKKMIKERISRKMTQFELANAINVSENTISRIERQVKPPSFETLGKICIGLDLSFDEILMLTKKDIIASFEK